jgi:hypothetical protein
MPPPPRGRPHFADAAVHADLPVDRNSIRFGTGLEHRSIMPRSR